MLPHTTSAVSAFPEDDVGRPNQFASKTGVETERERVNERETTRADVTWAQRDEGPTQGTHTKGTHTGDPHRGPAQGTHTGTHTEGRAPQGTHHRRGGPHRGPTQNTHRQKLQAFPCVLTPPPLQFLGGRVLQAHKVATLEVGGALVLVGARGYHRGGRRYRRGSPYGRGRRGRAPLRYVGRELRYRRGAAARAPLRYSGRYRRGCVARAHLRYCANRALRGRSGSGPDA